MATERVWEVREVKAGAVRVAGVTGGGDGAKITVPLSSNRGDGVPSLQRLQSHQHQVGGVKQRAMEAASKIMIRTTQCSDVVKLDDVELKDWNHNKSPNQDL